MAKHVKKYHLSFVATEAHSPDRGAVSIPHVHGGGVRPVMDLLHFRILV